MATPIWAGKYIGIPYKVRGRTLDGLDCWGLVCVIARAEQGITLPSFADRNAGTATMHNVAKIGQLIKEVIPDWIQVWRGRERCLDVIVLRLHGHPMHVGVVLGDGLMLHIDKGIDSCIESYHSTRWKDRIYGFYRHASAGI